MQRLALLSILLFGLLLSACDDVTGLAGRSIEGTWRARVDGEDVRINLYEDGGRISGTGTWGYDRILIDGDRSGTEVYLEFDFSGYNPIEFEGTVYNREMEGWLHGSGFRGEPTTFWRD